MVELNQGVVIWGVFVLVGIPLIGYHVYDWLTHKPEPEDSSVSDVDPTQLFEIRDVHAAYFSAGKPLNTTQLIGEAL